MYETPGDLGVRVRNWGGGETIFLCAVCGFHRGDRASTPGLRTASTQRYCPLSRETCAKLVSSKGRPRQRALPVERSPLKTLTADDNWRMYPGLQSKLVVTLTSINQPEWLASHQSGARRHPCVLVITRDEGGCSSWQHSAFSTGGSF